MRLALWILALALLAPWPGDAPSPGPPRDSRLSPAEDRQGNPLQAQPGSSPTRVPAGLPAPGLGTRLLGPVASLSASAQWVRFDRAVQDGDYHLAYRHAERALALDSASPHGFDLYGSHLVFDRGGALLEPDPLRRVAWIQAGLEVLRRGTRLSRSPAPLHMVRGQILALYVAELASQAEDPLPWPGGEGAAVAEGLEDFERAAELGHPLAHERKHDVIQAVQRRAED